MKLPDTPNEGDALKAVWGQQVVAYLKALTPRPSPTVLPSMTVGGSTFATTARPAVVSATSVPVPRPLELTITPPFSYLPSEPGHIPVFVWPGSFLSVVPTNMFTAAAELDPTVLGLRFFWIEAAMNEAACTACEIKSGTAYPANPTSGFPSVFHFPLGYVAVTTQGVFVYTDGRGSVTAQVYLSTTASYDFTFRMAFTRQG